MPGANTAGKERAGHKYLRREPLPGGGWRYFYTDGEGEQKHHDHPTDHPIHTHWEQHVAGKREAPRHTVKPSITSKQEPPVAKKTHAPPVDDAKPVVQALGTDAQNITHVHHEHHGLQSVEAHEWPEELDQYYRRGLEAAYPASGATVALRLVPEKLLGDLQGDTDQEKLADLARKAPDVLAKLEQAFTAASVAPVDAQSLISDVLRRENWAGSARAELIGRAIGAQAGLIVTHHRQLADAAENLAGGDRVTSAHVAASIGLLGMGGAVSKEALEETGGEFPAAVADLGKRAEAELDKLRGLLQAAKDDPTKAAELLAQAMASDAMHKLKALTRAFPGLQDKATAGTIAALEELPANAPRTEPTVKGASTTVFVAGEGGRVQAIKARYKLVEASELIPSHDPETFSPNPGYNARWQERAYHRDASEQARVQEIARKLQPELIANTNPDAVNGAPVVLPDGVVMGGNKRTMSSQLAYRKGKAGHLREYLTDNAHQFGFKPEDVTALVNPVLVREIDPEDKSDENMGLLSRQLNESFTQAMDPRTMMVAMSRRFNEAHLLHLGDTMEEGDTLRSYLKSGRSSAFRDALEKAGIIDERNRSAYVDTRDSSGYLNEDGVRLVERIIVGKMVGDADLLANTDSTLIESLARSVPHLVRAEGNGADYNLRKDLHQAIDTYNTLKHLSSGKNAPIKMPSAKSSQQEYDSALAHIDSTLDLGEEFEHSAKRALKNPTAKALLEVLVRRPGVLQMSSAFKSIAEAAEKNQDLGQGGLFGAVGPSFSDVVVGAVQRHLGKELPTVEEPPKLQQENPDQGGLF